MTNLLDKKCTVKLLNLKNSKEDSKKSIDEFSRGLLTGHWMHCLANDRLWQEQNISLSLGMSAFSLKQTFTWQ
jgi:hypothetical protein